ncbi:MFS transporter [Dokdonia pacifica]|uniref:Fucose permease n=1 Tax=Dokdonia pacifica TaxID=1627892 RepID=A0A238VRS2_9FLAO|nr:MFS transporter [Dokdonia pacifica]GGG18459.1 MFS transporter [Dokdonia pacifica]SNR36847.1 Fucose permease [Dokdonia pacifica]
MKNIGIKISLYLNYFVFAILLNSVGIVISKSINVYNIGEGDASVLEAFKDMPIAIVSFIVASFLPRFGYKKAMLIALAIVFLGCIGMYYGNTFDTAKLLFMSVGISFALIKLSVYSLIGVITNNSREHSSLMSSIEGFFMVGIASAYFIFPAFYSEDPNSWLNVYPVLCALIGFSFILLLFSKIDIPIETSGNDLKSDIKNSIGLLVIPLVLIFIFSAFFFVMVEQGIMTWLPRFNEKIFSFSEKLSVQMASILALSLAAGRFIAGWVSKKIAWEKIVIVCSIISVIILLSVLPQLKPSGDSLILTALEDVPMLGFILPLIGLFIAPIYPLLNSTVLSNLPKNLHSPMSGLIIVFSALGGTIGSRIVGELFESIGGVKAFYFLIIPIILLILSVIFIKKLIKKSNAVQG